MTPELSAPPALSPTAALVRRADPDRFLTALFAPPERREALLVLYAFNHEIARARTMVREPMMALIRLQWWREVVEGTRRRHEVAGPLGEALDAGAIPAAPLRAMISGREREVEEALDGADWVAWLGETEGALGDAAGLVLGADAPERGRLRALAVAYGAARVVRRGGATGFVVAEGRRALAAGGGRFSRHAMAAALPGVLARRDLRRTMWGPRGLGDRLAVTMAALTRWV